MYKNLFFLIAIMLLLLACGSDDGTDPPSNPGVMLPGEFPVVLTTEIYMDNTIPDIEPSYSYDWADPVQSDLLDANIYTPDNCNNYIRDGYGPRTLSDEYDLHLGLDIADCLEYQGEEYDDGRPATVFSMCSGIVENIDPNNKCSVYVTCDLGFANPDMGDNVEFIYRHLDEFDQNIAIGQRIEKGAPIGIMGTCEANVRHLHLSTVRNNPHENVNGSRMFDFERNAYFNRLNQGSPDDVDIRIIESNSNTTVRFTLLGNKSSTVQLGIRTAKFGDVNYNFEAVNYTSDGSAERDNSCFVDKVCLYTYDFNGVKTACDFYEDQMDDLPADFPASPARGEGNFYPIECTGLFAKVSIVYDFVLQGFSLSDLEAEFGDTFEPYVAGVFGDAVRAAN